MKKKYSRSVWNIGTTFQLNFTGKTHFHPPNQLCSWGKLFHLADNYTCPSCPRWIAHSSNQPFSPWGLTGQVRVVMISRMAKPEEVLVVENEQGEAVREFMKDTDAINMYKSMRETLGTLCIVLEWPFSECSTSFHHQFPILPVISSPDLFSPYLSSPPQYHLHLVPNPPPQYLFSPLLHCILLSVANSSPFVPITSSPFLSLASILDSLGLCWYGEDYDREAV